MKIRLTNDVSLTTKLLYFCDSSINSVVRIKSGLIDKIFYGLFEEDTLIRG